ncbi:hypothetical protein NDU88_008790 [Pleurodeles waltl]|uniref:Uncharacterized protein n=1 Tax=Pleurodeles waltl TaxID=8319 RepID=A0AAV7RYN7_PLEWA|nr:hypothetical protein NDU88_008790 [Pleurodeles waltl]
MFVALAQCFHTLRLRTAVSQLPSRQGGPAVFPRDRARQRPQSPAPCSGCLKEGISAAHHSRRGDPPHLCQATDFATPPRGTLRSLVSPCDGFFMGDSPVAQHGDPPYFFFWDLASVVTGPIVPAISRSSQRRSRCPSSAFQGPARPDVRVRSSYRSTHGGARPWAPRRASALQAVVRAGRSIPLRRSLSPVSTLLRGRAALLVVRKRCRYFYCSFIGASLFLVYSEGQLFQTF